MKFTKSLLNVPKLRFKGFEGEWEKKRFKDILKIKSGSDYKKFSYGNIPVIGSSGSTISYIDKRIYSKPSVLIGRKGTINKPIYVDYSFWVIDTMFYSEINSNVNSKFIYYIFLTINWEKYSEQTGVPSLTSSAIHNIIFFLPVYIHEQQKIAKFFSLLDKQIELWETKLQLNEQLKRAWLNKVFSNKLEMLEKIELKDLTIESKERIDYKKIELGVVGKKGIRLKKEVFKFDLSLKENHQCKILCKNNLVIGMGSTQIDSYVNLSYESLGVSTAYKVYFINNKINYYYLNLLLQMNNKFLSKNFMIVSARQGKTVDINNLFKHQFYIHNIDNQNHIETRGIIFDKLLKNILIKKNYLIKIKKMYLHNLFVI